VTNSGGRETKGGEAILAAVDFSRAADAAFAQARFLARERGASLYVLHVVDAPGIEEMADLAGIPAEKLRERLGRERRRRLEQFLREADDGGEPVELHPVIAWGRPFEEIVRRARSLAVSLIVIGSSGHSADLERALFGSTAEKVLRAAPCPVLCVPGD
jgi:nucleotide-binding universal stress UspA family protein